MMVKTFMRMMEEIKMKILKFYTPTCMSCKFLGKLLDNLEGVEIIPVDATEDLGRVDEYNICTTPTLVFLNEEDKEVSRIEGMTTLNKVKEILDNN